MLSFFLALFLSLNVVFLLANAARPVAPVVPTVGAISSGVYRNVFAEAGYAQADIDARLASIWKQLFQGDRQTQAVVFPAQDATVNGSYVMDVANNDARTEGMSYGMMSSVQLNLQLEFDRIFRWYKKYMQHPPGDVRAGYSAWHCKTNGLVLDANAASDGETWFITALLFAAKRWGNTGAFNYTAEANFILTSLLNKEDPPCGVNGCQGVVNMFGSGVDADKDPIIVRFVPEVGAASFTDPSYHLPAFYEQWALSGFRTSYWQQAATVSRAFLRATTHPTTGLAPNYAAFSGERTRSGTTFSFDAWRTARNIAMDAAWYAKDLAWQTQYCNRIMTFFRNLSTWPNYGSEFTIEGQVTDTHVAPGLISMNAVCALASNSSIAWDFVDHLWNTTTPSGGSRYYDGVLYLEAWLHLSGNFRADWSSRPPTTRNSVSYQA